LHYVQPNYSVNRTLTRYAGSRRLRRALGTTRMNLEDHIKLSDLKGQCLLVVTDWELFDFLDDVFTDQGFSTQLVEPCGTPQQYQLLFEPGVSSATVHSILLQVGPDEIHRIAQINASGSTNGGRDA